MQLLLLRHKRPAENTKILVPSSTRPVTTRRPDSTCQFNMSVDVKNFLHVVIVHGQEQFISY
jgi:hypothetical protein